VKTRTKEVVFGCVCVRTVQVYNCKSVLTATAFNHPLVQLKTARVVLKQWIREANL